MLPESSIYIHFPFCKSKCYYCNFFSETNSVIKPEDYINLLIKEASQRNDYLNNSIVKSIYLGGGTPSLFSPQLISELLNRLYKIFNISENAEITIEVNPDDITDEYVKFLASNTKINRISIGIQSFNDKELKLINRRHSSRKAMESLEIISKHFDNFSLDLIYGLPSQDLESLNRNIEMALRFKPKHISVYSLTIEKGTPLFNDIQKKEINIPGEDDEVNFYFFIADRLKENGYDHYEISNYSLDGFKSKHNSAYWTGNTYLGLGPGAHSFDGNQRRWNFPSLLTYKTSLEDGKNYFETEKIDLTDSYNEYIMLAFRTKMGINLDYIDDKYGGIFTENTKNKLLLVPKDHLIIIKSNYSLNDAGFLFADKYASDFFINS
ncbi:MAG: radical SAM family heme chaperone HemW [Bacteroidales bacterium]|jgi:oxygen-independent coproporphyrinogen-3 oxidase|nr:radical SAM family heme chaperone HemW [Bacteroidales bacterium]